MWSAVDLESHTDVAVKIARSEDSTLAQEAALQGSIESPYVVRALDHGVGECGGVQHSYLVQELVTGLNLRDALLRGVPHNVDVTAWAYGLLRALQVLHSKGVVHRDVKPSNIMIPRTAGGSLSPQPKLVDFGTAALEGSCDEDASSHGTVLYMSPEQARGSGVGPASDLYSLGLVLLECLTGYRAFSLPTVESLVARTQRDPSIPDHVPAHWIELIKALTAMEPGERPSATEALTLLTRPRAAVSRGIPNRELALAV